MSFAGSSAEDMLLRELRDGAGNRLYVVLSVDGRSVTCRDFGPFEAVSGQGLNVAPLANVRFRSTSPAGLLLKATE